MTVAGRLPPGYRLIMLDVVDGTNAEARRRANAGAEAGTLIRARRQTAGRGRRGRRWDSPPGNLYLSAILRPDCSVPEAASLSFVAALAVADALAALVPPMAEIAIKWPNDLLLNRRKVAGILLESSTAPGGQLSWLIVGVGVNVESFPDDTEFPATSLRFEGAGEVTADQVMAGFARHFAKWLDVWRSEGFAPVRAAWLARAHGIRESVRVRLGMESFCGTFVDLDNGGALVVELDDGARRRVSAGDVFPPDIS